VKHLGQSSVGTSLTSGSNFGRRQQRSAAYPWIDLIEKREGSYDPELEPQLRKLRAKFFFGGDSTT
jgi:hypothetical protein